MSDIYIKWVWWQDESPQADAPILTYSKINVEDFEIERFELYRNDRLWGHCADPKATGRTMLADVPTGLVNPDWGIEKINAHAKENGEAYHICAITPQEYYHARKTHIGLDLPTNLA